MRDACDLLRRAMTPGERYFALQLMDLTDLGASQFYPALRRLADDGLIDWGKDGERSWYSLRASR